MDQDMVMLARVRLLGANRRVVRGAEGLWIYRLLTQVEPETYGSKLAYVLVEVSSSPLLREMPERRLVLLEEAVRVASALDGANPYRAKMLARALAARQWELQGSPAESLATEGRTHQDAPHGGAAAGHGERVS
ncbi:hypothetical protein ACKI1J_29720 [Streptomyces scabiei]|uniref:hypothetical protein n=1 Tax=Streptomyces scabiei TaxID=1930 RepID=UPI0038F6EB75